MSQAILKEIKEHAPFTFFATLAAALIVATIFLLYNKLNLSPFFDIIHPIHIFASSIVTSAIYYKYKKNIIIALLIGIIGSIFIGTLSDIIFPFLGGNLLSLKTILHIPLIESPIIILSTAIIGSLIGIKTQLTKMPHFVHVFLSVFASLFYLIAFSTGINLIYILISTIIVFIAVLIPCCISDIIFPMLFTGKKRNKTSNFINI